MLVSGLDGERGRNRTFNLLIKSQLLCQLSYAPFAWSNTGRLHQKTNISVTQAFLQGADAPSVTEAALRDFAASIRFV